MVGVPAAQSHTPRGGDSPPGFTAPAALTTRPLAETRNLPQPGRSGICCCITHAPRLPSHVKWQKMDGYSQAPETESWRLESILSCSPPTRLLKNAKESCFLMHPTGPFSPSGDSFTFRGYLQSFIDLYLLNITLAFLIHLNGVFAKVLNDFSFF